MLNHPKAAAIAACATARGNLTAAQRDYKAALRSSNTPKFHDAQRAVAVAKANLRAAQAACRA